MDIRGYEYIIAIAEQGSITRAAAQLFITQSALSRFLQRTEHELGLPLFFRKGNQYFLTEAGQQYVDTGRKIMHLDRSLSDHLAKELAHQKGQIQLGYGMGKTGYILEEILPQFYEKYPDVRIYAKAETSRKLMQRLENHEMDLVMVTNVAQMPGYSYLKVEHSFMALAVRGDSPLLEKAVQNEKYPYPMIAMEALENLKMVVLPQLTASGKLTQELFEKHGLHPKIILEVSDVRSLMEAVEIGLGAAMFLTVPVGKRDIHYLSVEGMDGLEQVTWLVFREDLTLSPAMRFLIQLITDKAIPSCPHYSLM